MYTQVGKSKKNKSRAVANSVAQKKSVGKQGFGFVDNRLATIAQRESWELINKHTENYSSINQRQAKKPIISANFPDVVQRQKVDVSSLDEIFLLGEFSPNLSDKKDQVLAQTDEEFLEFIESLTKDQELTLNQLFEKDFTSRATKLRQKKEELLAKQRELKKQTKELEDRAKDKKTLKSNFQINDDKSNHTKGNDIDNQTFKEIAELYSDIREGKTSLKIGLGMDSSTMKEQMTFQKDVLQDISKILQTESGRKLITDLARGNKPVNIGSSGSKAKAHQMSHPDTQDISDIFHGKPKTYKNASDGTGTGSDVKYVPNDYTGTLTINGQLTTTDTVLFHELTHAGHAAAGKIQTGKLTESDTGLKAGHPDIGVNKEEYATVGLGDFADFAQFPITENAYREEQKSIVGSSLGDLLYGKRKTYVGKLN